MSTLGTMREKVGLGARPGRYARTRPAGTGPGRPRAHERTAGKGRVSDERG